MNTKEKYELATLVSAAGAGLDCCQTPRLSKPEMHLLLKPFFLLDRHADRFTPINYQYSVVENSRAITRRWFVQPHALYGLPGTFDRDVTIVIYELVNENYLAKNLSVPRVMPIGTLRDFATKMGINPNSGKNVSAIKESLKRLKNTLVDSEETFFDNKKRRYVSISFRLLAGVGFVDEEEDGIKHEENFVIFDEILLSNLNTGYVMVVDVDCLRSLQSNIAKQLYAHLAYRFYVETRDGDEWWAADYDWLSIHLGIKRWNELWRAKQQLQDAHDELKQLGYISDYRWDGWRVLYRPGLVWKGEQLRRRSGKAKRNSRQPVQIPITFPQPLEPHDPFLPALTAFASGLPIGEERIKRLGLTTETAKDLCREKQIPLCIPD